MNNKERGNPLPRLAGSLKDYTLCIDGWHTPASDYAEKEIGNYRIHHGKYTGGTYRYWGVDNYLVFNVKRGGIPITSLQEKRGKRWCDWMVDDPPNYRAMQIYAEHAKGRVLVAGLGLGLYLHELAKNPKVEKVTVVEISPEVNALVQDYLPRLPEFVVLLEDFYQFLIFDINQWDTILVDLWVSNNKEHKMWLLYHRVLPLLPILATKYPKAEVTFHGFQSVSAVKPVSEAMVRLIDDIGGI